jgi:plastocyanin
MIISYDLYIRYDLFSLAEVSMKKRQLATILKVLGFSAIALYALPAMAVDTIDIVIKDHKFEPAEVTIPAGTKVKLVIHNQDASAEEFESHSMHREKIIPGGAKRSIFIGPLDAGTYKFFGEFNPKTAQGRVIVK